MEFPFVRGREYTFAKLSAFQSELLKYRQGNRHFSSELRCNNLPWAKVYNEEILPIAFLAEGKRFGERETFRLMPEGDQIDVELGLASGKRFCQITLGDPMWHSTNSKEGGGYLHSLKMELIGEGLPVFGGSKTRRKNGIIVSEPHVLDQQERSSACRLGLIQAIARKQRHDGSGIALLVYARGHRFQMIDSDSLELSSFVSETVREIRHIRFRPLWVVDDGFLWELS